MKPILAITMGDPAGIGPEICARSLSHHEIYGTCRPLIVGDASIMQKAIDLLDLDLTLNPIHNVKDAKFTPGIADVFDLGLIDLNTFEWGKVQVQCGNAAFQYVKKAIDLAMANEVDGTCTAPLNKEALHKAGHNFDGHTEIYAHYTNTKKYAMLLADEYLRVIHVSTHCSLREACDRVKKDRVIEVTELIIDACRQFGIENPHIGIAGLNPHASENGLFGWEEEKEIIPAVEEMRKKGYNVEGPFQWNKETGKMETAKGVNITLGLPIIRVSVDHGTAFDVALQGVAAPDAMLLSIDYASRMALNRKNK